MRRWRDGLLSECCSAPTLAVFPRLDPLPVDYCLCFLEVAILSCYCCLLLLVLLASVLQAASARDFLNAGALEAATRGRDLLKLAHCRTDSSPARPAKTSNWEVGRGTPVLLGTCFAWERAGRAVGLPWYPTAEGPILGPRQHRPQTWSWGNDPPENGQYGAVGRQLSAHRPRLCPPEAVRGTGSHPTEVKRSRPISAAIGGRDPRSRAATRREWDEPYFLWIAEPACGSHSRPCRLQRRPAIVRLRLSPQG